MPSRYSGRRGNLPAELTSFIGRRQEVAEVAGVLSTSRLVTLVGVGGVGKTRLALRVADRVRRAFRDGVWFVEFGQLHDEALVAHTVLATLGAQEEAGRRPVDVLATYLTGRQILLVLDNCEHLVGRLAKLADALLRTNAGLRVLATSREPLGLQGEHVFPVPTLSVPERAGVPVRDPGRYEAVALFLDRAAAVAPEFRLTDGNREAVVDICRELDGLPLAIELAVARLRVLAPAQIRDRLGDRLTLLTTGSREAPPRQQALWVSIEWSYDLCTGQEQRLWAWLSVFAGPFDLDTVEGVCGGAAAPGTELIELVASLVDKSVLVVGEGSGPVMRYRLLDSLRAYGQRRLRDTGTEPELRRRHLDWYERLVLRAEANWFGARQVDWLARLDRDHADIRAALEYAVDAPTPSGAGAPHAVRMAGALWPYWIAGGYIQEGRHWLERALAAQTAPGPDRARALWVAGLIAGLQGDTGAARGWLAECHRILAGSSDATALAAAARAAGTVEMLAGAHRDAVTWLERSVGYLAGARRMDSLALLAYADLGVVRALGGDVRAAIVLCEQGRARCVAHEETWALSWILSVLNFVHFVEDDQRDITADVLEMLRIKESFHDVLGVLHAVEMLAWVAAAHGDAPRAARLLGGNERHWRPLGAYLLGFQPYLDRHAECVARARARLGDADFDAAFAAGAQLELPRLVAYARGEPAAPGPAPPGERAGSVLTRREWQVAQLVAEGLSDKQIAERLVIGQRTAEAHVANILGKLGFRSRAQVAGWVSGRPRRR